MPSHEKALFCCVISEKGDKETLSKILSVAASTREFSRFMAYFEAPHDSGENRPKMEHDEYIGEHVGTIAHVKHTVVNTWLKDKRVTEDRNRRKPGHSSYTPADVLPTNTCVVVVGSRGFCATLARVHMEEIAELHHKLFDILEHICTLDHLTGRATIGREDLLIVEVDRDHKNYITYNLRWMYEHVQKASERVEQIYISGASAHGGIE